MRGDRAGMIFKCFRYAVYLSIIVMIFWITSRFSFVGLEPGDSSVVGVSGYRRLLVEKLSEGSEITKEDVLVFAMLDASDEQVFRVSRVKALPGDDVGAEAGKYTINGEPTEIDLSKQVNLEGVIPDGFFLLLNDNPFSPYPDSRRIGLIDQRWVVGRFLSEMPF